MFPYMVAHDMEVEVLPYMEIVTVPCMLPYHLSVDYYKGML